MSNEKAPLQADGEVDCHLVMDSLVSKIKGCEWYHDWRGLWRGQEISAGGRVTHRRSHGF